LIKKPQAMEAQSTSLTRGKSFTQGIIVNTFNPKVALFFLSFLPQFIDEKLGSAALQSLILGSMFVAIGLCTDGMYAILASALRTTLLRGKSLPFVQRYVAGSVFVLLGVIAASTKRS
jgi:threonine/homoserine/homoserine lactone efflux protein